MPGLLSLQSGAPEPRLLSSRAATSEASTPEPTARDATAVSSPHSATRERLCAAAETQRHQKQTNKVKNTYLKKDLPPLPADLANAFWLAGRSVLTIPLLALPAPRSKVSWRHVGGWRAAHAPPGLQEDVNSNMQTLGARAAVSERGGALTPRAEEVTTSGEFGAPAGG